MPPFPQNVSSSQPLEGQLIEVIKGRLYYTSFPKPPPPSQGVHYFSTDRSLIYWNFFLDFGPMNLGQTYRFCEMLEERLARYPNDKLVYYSGIQGQRRSNSVLLLCAYSLIILGKSAEDAYKPFLGLNLMPFHDATPCACTYDLRVFDCLKGLEKAKKLGFLNFDTFNVEEYEHFEKVESGDLSWVFPGKFVAFAGPHEVKSYDEQFPTCVPEDYVSHFLEKNVGLVIRLNKKYYDENRFKKHGIHHEDLYYPDGSCPSDDILDQFLQLCESRPQDQAIAVHCKAGLGRTGTCIGAYAMKHWGFTAAEVIGWMRVARPGSVIGPQQHYMESIQERMHRSIEFNSSATTSPRRAKSFPSRGSSLTAVTPLHSYLSNETDDTDKSQGDFLINAKVHSPHSPALLRKSLIGAALEKKSSSSSSSSTQMDVEITSQEDGEFASSSFSLRGAVARKLYGK